jgi:hypothetical protein
MARDQYFVVLHDDTWKIKHNDQHSAPYPSQAAAIEDAVERAKQTSDRGGLSQVLVQGEDLTFRTELTYGMDPFPPLG